MEGKDLRQAVPGVHVTLPSMRLGGVALQVFAVYVPPETESGKAFQYTSERLAAIDAFAGKSDLLTLVETSAELKKSMTAGKTGILKAVENGHAIEDSLEKLKQLRRSKVRIMTLTHSKHLSWIASCTGSGPFKSDSGPGLTSFGESVVDAMCDLGMIPDLSHASESAFWDVIKRVKKPVIASHSCAYKLCAAARNLKDDQLKALGDSGGLVGVNFFSGFLNEPYRLQFNKYMKNNPELSTQMIINNQAPEIPVAVPLSSIADHIDYMVNEAGEDCVALGSDFDGIPSAPDGVTGSGFYPVLEAELRSRGYTEKRIEKIFNANFLRVLSEWD